MGNAYPCKSKKPHPSVKKQHVNQTILNRIFHIAKKKHYLSPAVKTERNMDKYREKMHVDDMDVVRLEVHMTSHIKGLIDYLESNHNKLADTGKYVSKTVIKSSNPEIHILGLLVLRDLLNNIEKFCYNQDLLSRLVGGQGLENVTLTIEERRKIFQVPDPNEEGALDNSPDIVGFKSDMMGNIMEFEGSVMEVLSFTCDRKRNPLYDSSFKYSLQVFNLYTKKHLGVIPSERIEHILKEMIEIMHAYSNVDDQESLERNYQLIEIMTNLTKMPNIVLQFKHKFTQYSCSILRDLYLDDKKRSSEATGLNGSNSPTEMNTLKKETKQKVFGLIELVVQSLSDLTEFDILMTPIFAFFDETEWTEEQLQKDVFSSLQNSMKDNTSFEQIEIFLMEKIIEYIDYDKIETQVPIGRYKNYKNPQVKAKVFAVLEVVLEESKKSFLSFLVADRMMICFMEILGELNISNSQCAHLKQSIYNCQRSFINKINNSAKSLTQVINCITAQIHKKSQGNHFDLGQIMEQIEFLNFTLDTTQSFPSKAPVPKDSIIMLLKLRDSQRMLFSTFLPIEKLLGLTYEIEGSEERVDSRGSALIPCEGEVGNALVSNNLTILQNLIKERRTLTDQQSQKDMRLLDFLLHYSRVNKSLLNRKEPILLKGEMFSIKKIMDLIQTEIQIYQQKKDEQAKQNTSLLIYFLYDLIRTIADAFEIYSLGSQVERLTQRVPIDAFRLLEDNKQNLTRKTSDSIFECLRNSNLILSPWSEAERDSFLEILVSELKPYLPLLTIDKLKREIPDKDAYEDYSYNMNFLDDETASFQPPEFKSLPSMRADSLIRRESINVENLKMTLPPKRKESMNIFNQVTSFEVPQKHIATTKITETIPEKDYSDSSVIDASFRKQLTDAHREKEKELNLSRILNDEIY